MHWYYILLIVISSLLLVGLLLFVILGELFYEVSFSRRKGDKNFATNEDPEAKKHHSRVWFFSQRIEEYQMKSFDKKLLKGYMIRNGDSKKVALLVHGYHGRYYSLDVQAEMLYKAGYNIFAINHRASDTSQGRFLTMGPKETKDVLDWINLLVKENNEYEIVLLGVSMGAHIVMMVSGNKNLPSNVKCSIEDCGYASLEETLHRIIHSGKIPHFLAEIVFICGRYACKLFHGHSMNSDTKDALSVCNIPMLFIHGSKDTFVTFDNLNKNYSNLSTAVYKEKRIFEAGHAESYRLFEAEYCETIVNFVNRFIK